MIRFENVSKTFDGKAVLKDISLTISHGDRVALTGRSGSGKTTLLRLIAGLDFPDSGEIYIDGKLASAAGRIILAPHLRNCGLVFQSSALWPHMNVSQNIVFGIEASRRGEMLPDILARTGITHLAKRMPDTLSGGEKRRVAIARTLAATPAILLMDEPLTNLDDKTKSAMVELFENTLNGSDTTLIYVTHDIGEIDGVQGAHLEILEGQVVVMATPRGIST